MSRRSTALALLVLLQGLLLGAWWFVDRSRAAGGDLETAPSASFVRVGRPAPELWFVRRDGSIELLGSSEGRVLVHFWATWCPPCLEELPSLLAWAERADLELLAVSVDPEWAAVDHFLGGTLPPTVVRADGEAARRWGADRLPTSFVVDGGRITAEARGAVRWGAVELPN